MVAEHADVGLNPLVIVFYLSLCLQVVWCGESLINVKGFEEPPCVFCSEGGASVRVVYFGDSMYSEQQNRFMKGQIFLQVKLWLREQR